MLIVLSILWIVSIYSVISALINSIEIGVQCYIGYGLLIGVSILKFYKVKKTRTILGIFLALGSTNIFQFTASSITFFIAWTPMGHRFSTFGIQPLSVSLLIFFILVNYSDFRELLADTTSEDPEIILERQKRVAAMHYADLKKEKDAKLLEIIDNKSMYLAEYVNIAHKVLEERRKH